MRSSVRAAILLLVAVVPARGEVGGEFVGRTVAAIEFHCPVKVDKADLYRLVPVRPGDTLAARDADRIRERLMQRGIFTAVNVTAVAEGERSARLVVELARKAVVDRVRFYGNRALRDSALERVVRLAPSGIYSDDARQFAEHRIRERYAAEGFSEVAVQTVLSEPAPGEVDVTFDIHEGQPLRVDGIEFDGDLPIPLADLQRAAGVKVGSRYARNTQRKTEKAVVRALRRRGYYEAQVDSRWEAGDNRRGRLHVHIVAGPLVTIEINGNAHLSDRRIGKLLDLLDRPIITDGTWRELARRTRRAYQESGYYFATVGVHVVPGSPKIVRLDVVEGPSLRVADVSFDGNRGLSATSLRAAMQTGPPSWIPWRRGVLLDDVLDEDLRSLWYLYRRHGFESAEIVDLRTQFDRDRGKITITVVIEEGRRTTVIAVEHNGFVGVATLPSVKVQPGVPLNPDDVERDRRALLSAQLQVGYPHAAVQAAVSRERRGDEECATVRFEATPGTAQRVGTIIVQNNIDTKSRVVLRELTVKPGDPLDPEALASSQTRLYRLGLFRTVDVRPIDDATSGDQRDLAVTVAEKAPGSLQLGAGYNTRDGLRGFGEIAHNNLQGLNRRLSLRGEVALDPSSFSPNEYLGVLGYRDPRLQDSLWALRTDLIAQRSTRSIDQFSVERFALVPALDYPIRPGLRVGSELVIEQSQVFDVASDVLAFNPSDQGRLRTIGLGPFIVYEGRDDPFMPRRGVFESFRVRWAPEATGSDVPFVRIQAQHSHYVPLTDALTWIYVARIGWGYATESHDQLPIRERFFLGGRTTVRGFSENSIGPTGTAGNPIGGDFAVNLNTELRFPLAFGVGGATFVDGGGLYLQDTSACKAAGAKGCAINLDNFRRSAGLGLRYDTPVGPLALDYGFKLDTRSGESIGEVHFSIGANW